MKGVYEESLFPSGIILVIVQLDTGETLNMKHDELPQLR
jgi:hypothetical protein